MFLRRLQFLILLLPVTLHAAAPGVYAISGGTVHRASGAPLQDGTVIIRGGLIEAVGSGIPIPADATVIDVRGQHVYPGLFDAQTSLGLPAPPPRRRAEPGQPARPAPETPKLPPPSPAFVAAQNFTLSDDTAGAWRSKGITTVLIASNNDVFNGQSAILNLAGDTPQAMILKAPASTQVSFKPRDNYTYPGSLMGVISFVRQTFLDAQQNELATGIYARNPSGKERPVPSPDLEALRPVLRRDLPVVFMANDELMIRRAAEIAREFNLRWVVSGAQHAYRAADYLASTNAPVLFSVDFPRPPGERREDQPLRLIRDRVLAPTGPAELAKKNVRFALVSGTATSASSYLGGIRKTVEKGLAEEDALRAVTLWPAQIFGVERQIGSLDRGKIANVFVTDKRFFDRDAKVSNLFIDGRRVTVSEEKEGEDSDSPVAGTWNLAVRAAGGEVGFEVILRPEGDRLEGSYSGDAGSGDIRDGSVQGSSVQFTITAKVPETGETSDWRFEGQVTGSSIQGTVTTTEGTFDFSGSKPE